MILNVYFILRNRIGQEKLVRLALMSVLRDIVIDIEKVIKRF